MGQVLLDIKNEEKAKFLLDFLKQIDFVEIKRVFQKDDKERGGGKKERRLADVLLNAPVLSEEELDNIERVGREFGNWTINEF